MSDEQKREGAQQVYLLWEMEHLEAVVTNRGLAQRWTDSADTRGFTTETVDSQLKRLVLDQKIAGGAKV